jgi:hypothetical protein
MKEERLLTTTSLLSILLLTFHFTDDLLHEGGIAVRGAWNLIAVLILFVLLYGTLMLGERRSGLIIMLIAGLAALGMPVIHMVLAQHVFTNEIARARGDYFFVWTLLALGVTGSFGLVLSSRGLWNLRKGHGPSL